MSRSKTVYVFRCGSTALFALTTDRSGQNLPSQIAGPAGWHFERSIAFQLDKSRRRQESIRATLAAIAKHGFYLTHPTISTTAIEGLISPRDDPMARGYRHQQTMPT